MPNAEPPYETPRNAIWCDEHGRWRDRCIEPHSPSRVPDDDALEAERPYRPCRSGYTDCTADCAWCKGTHVEPPRFPTAEQPSRSRKSSLSTLDWYLLNRACEPVWDAFGGTYLVGTAATGGEYRDVDVRTILHDDDFDRLCGDRSVWTLLCTSIGLMLREQTGMVIDYQIQRMTEANDKYPGGWRHPVGMVVEFAGGGDATRFAPVASAGEGER